MLFFQLFQFKCDHYGKIFVYSSSLRKHDRIKHAGVVFKYECPECGVSCSQRHTLNAHMLDFHKGKKKKITSNYIDKNIKIENNDQSLPKVMRNRIDTGYCCKCGEKGKNGKGILRLKNFQRNVLKQHGDITVQHFSGHGNQTNF